MTKRKMAIAGLLLLAIIVGTVKVIGITGWGNTVLFPVSQAGREIMAPFYKGINVVTSGTRSFLGYFRDNNALRQENEKCGKNWLNWRKGFISCRSKKWRTNACVSC